MKGRSFLNINTRCETVKAPSATNSVAEIFATEANNCHFPMISSGNTKRNKSSLKDGQIHGNNDVQTKNYRIDLHFVKRQHIVYIRFISYLEEPCVSFDLKQDYFKTNIHELICNPQI